MTPNGKNRRAPAKCDQCGEIGIVRIWDDGTVKPVGQANLCDCESPTLCVLVRDEDEREDAGVDVRTEVSEE